MGGCMSAHVAFMCMDACHSVVRSLGLACLVAYDLYCLQSVVVYCLKMPECVCSLYLSFIQYA